MDKDVAEWLPQWFSPIDQVEVSEITSAGVIKHLADHERLHRQARRPLDRRVVAEDLAVRSQRRPIGRSPERAGT